MNSVHSASLIHPATPLVSIVLPVYNGSRYLHSSIRSVMDQTMRDWEFIIWDDGSSDTSAAILNDYASDPRVRLHSHSSNKGLFETLNAAISVSRGRLIRLWSQDDIMKPDCLEAEANFNESHPDIAMSYCQYDVIDAGGVLIRPAKE